MNEQPQNENNENTGQIQIEEKNTKKHENKDEKRKWHVRATVALLIIIIILLLLLLRQCSSGIPVLNPDYPPQQDETNAIVLPGDDDKLQDQEGGGAVNLRYRDKLTLDLSDKQVSLFFANPTRSTQDMVLWLLIQDQVIAQSGRIRPGYQIGTLDLAKNAEKMLSEGVYEGKFVIYYYHPETNERAMVNTEAPVTVTVKQ